MAITPKSLQKLEKTIDSAKSVNDIKQILRIIRKEQESVHHKLRDDITRHDGGVSSGHFDDGANFRVTVTNGIITEINDSSGAGHS
ncbi:MAG: hypothetical protein PVJ60_06345 [Phycisphaerales bacterium]